MFSDYQKLLEKIDRFAATLRAKYPQSFACSPGCADCCVGGIRVWRVEGDHIAASNARNASNEKQARKACGYLDEECRCTIYDARPVVCRLWGLPIAGEGTSEPSCCGKNFVQGVSLSDLPPADAINQQTVLTALAAINHVYCRNIGADPEERYQLAR